VAILIRAFLNSFGTPNINFQAKIFSIIWLTLMKRLSRISNHRSSVKGFYKNNLFDISELK
jgi:hypothetical protein